jgi:hypothetical protein
MIKSHLLYQLSYASPWAIADSQKSFDAARFVVFQGNVKRLDNWIGAIRIYLAVIQGDVRST